MEMSLYSDIFMNESQLFRAYSAPTAVEGIRNPGYRPSYSYLLARLISVNSLMQAWLIHSCYPGLSRVEPGDIYYETLLHNSLSISSSINHTIQISPVLHILILFRKGAEGNFLSPALFRYTDTG